MTTVAAPADPTASTIRTLGLLAGAGAQVGAIDDWWRRSAERDDSGLRSCIDTGSRLLVSLSVPAQGRQMSCYARIPGPSRPGITHWSRLDWESDLRSGWRTWYSDEPVGTWDDVLAVVDRDDSTQIADWHRILGPAARVYSVSVDRDRQPWVSWQLDPRVEIARALGAVGHAPAWQVAAGLLGELLGRVPTVAAPWSLAVRSDGLRWRIGTSRWARIAETDHKRRRYAWTVGTLGGDRQFAEATYKVLSASAGQRTVGRAVELEFDSGNSPAGAEFFLAVSGTPDVSPAPRVLDINSTDRSST